VTGQLPRLLLIFLFRRALRESARGKRSAAEAFFSLKIARPIKILKSCRSSDSTSAFTSPNPTLLLGTEFHGPDDAADDSRLEIFELQHLLNVTRLFSE